MIDPHILLVLVAVLIHDALGKHEAHPDDVAMMLVLAIGVPLAIIVAQHIGIRIATRKLMSSGHPMWVGTVRRMQWLGASVGIGAYLVAMFGFGWLAWVRGRFGDWVLLDELLVVLPTLCVIGFGWWSGARMEQVLRDAVMLRRVDAGQEVYPPMSGLGIVLDRFRHRAALVLIPVVVLVGWSEIVWLASTRAMRESWGGLSRERIELLAGVVEFAAIVALIVLLPVLLRVVWRTSELGAGSVRDRLVGLCQKHGVRVRHILVWWTHGTMINGAVVGVLGWTRAIMLTDELLACLSDAQVEAVMAHEVAHIKRRHIQWMLLLLGGGLMGVGALADLTGRAAVAIAARMDADTVLVAKSVVGAMGLAVLISVFGVVSRRFERQADAFAVQHSSGLSNANPRGFGLLAQREAIDAMSGSLEHIAVRNNISMGKRMFRHGSIGSRVRSLRVLEGVPLDHFPIDRIVRTTKRGILLGVVAVGGLVALGYVFLPTPVEGIERGETWVVVDKVNSPTVIPTSRDDISPSGGE